MRLTVITSIVGDRDTIRNDQTTEGADFIAFTDQESDLWEVRPPYGKFKENVMNAKVPKILPHRFVDTDVSMWLDGNMALQTPFPKLVKEWLGDYDLAIFPHPTRRCLYHEIEACIQLGKGNKEELLKQRDKYLSEGFPYGKGMAQCNMIIRKHNERTARFNEMWWAEICSQSSRDQVSFPYVLDKSGIKFKYLSGKGYVEKHPWFHYSNTHHSDYSNRRR